MDLLDFERALDYERGLHRDEGLGIENPDAVPKAAVDDDQAARNGHGRGFGRSDLEGGGASRDDRALADRFRLADLLGLDIRVADREAGGIDRPVSVKSIATSLKGGGSAPLLVEILPHRLTVTGAISCLGNFTGMTPPAASKEAGRADGALHGAIRFCAQTDSDDAGLTTAAIPIASAAPTTEATSQTLRLTVKGVPRTSLEEIVILGTSLIKRPPPAGAESASEARRRRLAVFAQADLPAIQAPPSRPSTTFGGRARSALDGPPLRRCYQCE